MRHSDYSDETAYIFGCQPARETVDLTYVGRLSREKNLEQLLQAARDTSATLRMIGSGPERDRLRARFQDLEHKVDWIGRVKNEELPDHIRSSRVFVLPSLYEGHPKSLLEAMSCGRAVLGTDVVGIQDVIQHGETGWLCKTDATSLAAGITKLLGDASLRKRLGSAARKHVAADLSLERIVELENQVLERVLGDAGKTV